MVITKEKNTVTIKKENIRSMGEVSRELAEGRFKVLLPIYRRRDNMLMAGKGFEINESRIKKMQNEILEALKGNKRFPYYTEKVEIEKNY